MIIGVVAPSMGIYDVEGLEKTKSAIKHFESQGHKVILGNIFNSYKYASSDKKSRAVDFMKIYKQADIIISIAGGESLIEVLEFIDFDYIKNNPKLFMGYSDNTNISFTLTVLYDIPTIYGLNFKSFGKKWDLCINNFYDLIFKGLNKFEAFKFIEEQEPSNYLDQYNLTKPNKWKYILDNKMEGILLGGCLDVILNLINTKYDNTLNYIKDKDIIWYFDVCDLNIFMLKRALIQLHLCGYFKTCKGIIISRFYNSKDMFETTLFDVLNEFSIEHNISIFYDVDLGHMPPVIPFVNGLKAKVYIDEVGHLEYDSRQIKALTR